MNINNVFPSQFLKAGDLGGKTITVTIRDVKVEKVGQNQDTKPVCYFEGKQKGFVLNKTNARKIASIAGSADTEDWHGVTIAIFPTETEFSGETVECIRVKPPQLAGKKSAPTPPPAREPGDDDLSADDIGF